MLVVARQATRVYKAVTTHFPTRGLAAAFSTTSTSDLVGSRKTSDIIRSELLPKLRREKTERAARLVTSLEQYLRGRKKTNDKQRKDAGPSPIASGLRTGEPGIVSSGKSQVQWHPAGEPMSRTELVLTRICEDGKRIIVRLDTNDLSEVRKPDSYNMDGQEGVEGYWKTPATVLIEEAPTLWSGFTMTLYSDGGFWVDSRYSFPVHPTDTVSNILRISNVLDSRHQAEADRDSDHDAWRSMLQERGVGELAWLLLRGGNESAVRIKTDWSPAPAVFEM
ncbi:hypothetical protein HKX48_001672 [Thoreauomyces humboldtii]|nr:hypothetical protein HKX48_001672 [Thoreauomyces humboldtii]